MQRTYPMIQTTAPTRDKSRATKANGSPSKNPNGLQSPISFKLFLIFLLCILRCFKDLILGRKWKKEIKLYMELEATVCCRFQILLRPGRGVQLHLQGQRFLCIDQSSLQNWDFLVKVGGCFGHFRILESSHLLPYGNDS